MHKKFLLLSIGLSFVPLNVFQFYLNLNNLTRKLTLTRLFSILPKIELSIPQLAPSQSAPSEVNKQRGKHI